LQEVYADLSCTSIIQTVEFSKSESCTSDEQTAFGAADGFANFKYI